MAPSETAPARSGLVGLPVAGSQNCPKPVALEPLPTTSKNAPNSDLPSGLKTRVLGDCRPVRQDACRRPEGSSYTSTYASPFSRRPVATLPPSAAPDIHPRPRTDSHIT